MTCPRISRLSRPAPWWHRLRCSECRAARASDAVIALGVACLKAAPLPADGLRRTLRALDLPFSPPARRLPRWRVPGRTLALTFAILSLAGAGATWGWLRWIDQDPHVPVPTPALPRPNAFDTYRTTGAMMKDIHILRYTGYKPGRKANPNIPEDRYYTWSEKEALLRENAEALRLLRAGLKQDYREPPVRSFETTMPYLNGFRDLGRLLALEGETRTSRGDWTGAARSGLDTMEFGMALMRGAGTMGRMTGLACEKMGRPVVWQAMDQLNAPDARAAARRLEGMLARRAPMAETLTEEKWSLLAGLQAQMRRPGWRTALFPKAEELSGLHEKVVYLNTLPYSKRRILENVTRYMDREIANAREPWQPRPWQAGFVPDDPISQLILPACAALRQNDMGNGEAPDRLLLTALALRAYRLERGTYPMTLSALAPDYLASVPTDPFASFRPLRYWRTEDTYRLYSVGSDGLDSGGVPVPRDNHMADGDIVAGEERK